MFIYTAKKGETLTTIAKQVGTTAARLQELNQTVSNKLTAGINLLLPGPPSTLLPHTVGPKETLTSIASTYQVPVYAIAGANGLEATANLEIGQILFVPRVLTKKTAIETNGYLIPSATREDEITIRHDQPLTYLTVFSYHVNENGTIEPLEDDHILALAKATQTTPLLCLTNFDGNNFNSDLAHAVLVKPALQQKITESLMNILHKKAFRGVNVDFEHLHPSDRPHYNAFLRLLRERLHQAGYTLSIAMGPKTSDEPNASWMGAFDYKTIGQIVDFLMIMTYEWGWVGGPPMAVAPLDQVKAVLDYATSIIAPSKILMGMATYGYNWSLPDTPTNLATGISPNKAQNVAIEKQVHVRFDPRSASPMFYYQGAQNRHEVWYEDPKSMLIKMDLVISMQLRGISFWVLGEPFPQLWHLVADTFSIKKSPPA
nr:LysM peptidoglycan-binding domain-containing protein [Bacilli bacterium]